MTDRESVPAAPGLPAAAPRAPSGFPNTGAPYDSASPGDAFPMSVSITAAPQHRTPAPGAAAADRARAWIAQLPGLELDPYTAVQHLPPAEYPPAAAAAAARAAACPDLFVVHAPDPATAEPVVAELARFCETVGRVLVLSPDPAAADRVAERLVKVGCASVVRALAEAENPARPLPLAGKVTSAAVLAAQAEQLPREAAAAVAAIDDRLRTIEQLVELSEKLARLDAEEVHLSAKADEVAAAVRAETGTPFTQRLDALRAASDAERTRLGGERQSLGVRRAALADHHANLKKEHAAAVAEGAKKPGLFARLFGGAKRGADPADLERQIREAEAEVAAIDARLAEVQAKADGLAAALAADREKAAQEEAAARSADVHARLAAIASERQRVAAECETLARPLGSNPPAAGELADLRYAATRDLLAAREYAAEVNRAAPELARRALVESRVVVGTPGSLGADPVFDRAAAPFDLLVLDRAEELTEHDFVNLARLANRWVLVGDVPPVEQPRAQLNGAPRRGPSRNGRPAEVPFASRLAWALDRETWGFEADRLVCRLAFPHPDRRPAMTREPLLDRPEIELRFLADEDGEPVLAEVAFPGGTAIAAARSFLFHQLGEVLLRPCGEARWEYSPTAITASWPAAEQGTHPTAAEWIDLEPGVREKIVGHGLAAFTAAVSFDPAQGWDADRAAAWLAENAPAPSASRFCAVPSPRR